MTTAGAICSRASKTLFDDTRVRWDEPELLQYLSDAQRETVVLKPSAFTKNEAVQLAPGSVQTLPADGVALVDIGGNLGADGNTPGSSVRQIDRTVLEASRVDWRAGTANLSAKHYLYDVRDPLHFEVYPPQPNPAGWVRMVYAAVPPELTDAGDTVALPEIYDTALYYLVLARAFTKSTSTQDFTKAAGYQQIAHGLIVGRKGAEQSLHPNQPLESVRR